MLSRYNSDEQCAACRRTERVPVVELPTVPARVWQDRGVRAALADWDFGQVSRLIRQLVPLRQEDVAALTGLSQSYLSMLECGERRLTDIARVVQFLTGLGTPSEMVRLPLPDGGARLERTPSGSVQIARVGAAAAPTAAADDLDPELPWTADRMLAALGGAIESGADGRLGAGGVNGVALTAFVHHWGAEEAEPLRRAAAGARVSADLCDHLQGTIDELRVMDAGAGSGTVADLARAHLLLVTQILRTSTYDGTTGRRLAAIAADTATQTGWFAFDAGRHDAAQEYMLAGLRAAHQSGDVRLGAGALSYLAIHGYSTGHPRDAVVAAQAGRAKVRDLDAPALEAMLLTRQSRGHARLGEHQAAGRALEEAGELCALGRGHDDPHWLYWMNEGEIHGQTASAQLDLGEPDRAVVAFENAVSKVNPGDHRTRGLLLSRSAQAHARAGDLDAAVEHGNRAVDLAQSVQSVRLRDHLRDLANVLAPARSRSRSYGHGGARSLTERIAVLAPS